ncbi:MAG: 2-methoxy-6-polyprenyl-1,4-benzoquinol methylase, mitochondrial [Chroococcopsis gigantea SAG 12.99]|jgi:ubiquinone/menaquinone biosynthesis C-methylase UbiE|nr:class I SAM-dependent methyltransferase [Chlorogloea purpurea SAG 13.99]MDV3000726.1 2-methoxy-6-polyprenyl-1,4-benzoquinol methylase, mitochondrial [Chroococcopsis gigantea SAG 12.99]
MTIRKDTLWEQFLKPVFRLFLPEQEMRELSQSRNWKEEADKFTNPDLIYPDYYLSENFHGIEGGYLNTTASITYDPITRYVLPPGEDWIRTEVIKSIGGNPRRILDLGCGTGSTTLMLKKAFPDAQVTGVDLSPYMLAMAAYKSQREGLAIEWVQMNAERTTFPGESFDVVTAGLLFHETPPSVSRKILQECSRLLVPGGEVIILDGNQKALRSADWLTNVFEEPYIKEYAAESTEAWMGSANFVNVQSIDLWVIHQITKGRKPLLVENSEIIGIGLAPA